MLAIIDLFHPETKKNKKQTTFLADLQHDAETSPLWLLKYSYSCQRPLLCTSLREYSPWLHHSSEHLLRSQHWQSGSAAWTRTPACENVELYVLVLKAGVRWVYFSLLARKTAWKLHNGQATSENVVSLPSFLDLHWWL